MSCERVSILVNRFYFGDAVQGDGCDFQPLNPKLETFLGKIERGLTGVDRLRVGWLAETDRGRTQDRKISKGYLPRLVYHQVYNVY